MSRLGCELALEVKRLCAHVVYIRSELALEVKRLCAHIVYIRSETLWSVGGLVALGLAVEPAQ